MPWVDGSYLPEGVNGTCLPDFLYLEINYLDKGKEFAKMVKRIKIIRQLYRFWSPLVRPKIPHRWDDAGAIGMNFLRERLYWTLIGH